MSCKFIYSS